MQNPISSLHPKRLHPLLAAAAVSLMVLSAVGAATLTGLIPSSKSQESALELPKEVVKPIAPAISHPVRKTAARKPAKSQAEPIAAPVVVAESARPQPQLGQLATVESVREVKEAGDAKGVGAIAGGVVGGVLGNKLGKNRIVTVLGAAGGAFAGHQIEKQVRAEKRWETVVRLDDGSQRTISSEAQPAWRVGERVRLLDGKLAPV
jgi:outer membrane lipoprotein SlyB